MAINMRYFRGDRLKAIRKERNLSQEAFGDLMSEGQQSTVPQQLVSQWENGVTDPNAETLFRMARVLEISSDYLLGLTDISNDRYQRKSSKDELREKLDRALDKGNIGEALEAFTAITKRKH